MSVRTTFPSAREPDSHFFFTVSRGGRQKRFALRPGVLYSLFGLLPLVGAVYLGATAYLFFRDDMVAALMARQARQQYAYEDRLAAMRLQLDRVTSRQLIDQDSFEGKVQRLISREAQLETRTAIVAALGDRIGPAPDTTASIAPSSARRNEPQKRATPSVGGPEARVNAFAPTPQPMDDAPFATDKPRPDGFELRGGDVGRPAHARTSELAPHSDSLLAEAGDTDIATPARIEMLSTALDRIERKQVEALAALAGPAARKAERLEAVIAETGLSPSRLKPPAGKQDKAGPAMGGPFIPTGAELDGSPFERQLSKVQGAFVVLERLRRTLPYVPVRKPLAGALEVTSGFGYRTDPFLGRPALHSGLDMRAEVGAPARATAAGKVVTAGWTGGYGNMVEIDHGNGLSTRYGHLSAISVALGQAVTAGETIGRVGSTGRSTGPHLHYEVRIDDQATDPTRFVRAARLMAARD